MCLILSWCLFIYIINIRYWQVLFITLEQLGKSYFATSTFKFRGPTAAVLVIFGESGTADFDPQRVAIRYTYLTWPWMVWMCMEIGLLTSGFSAESCLKSVVLVFIYWYIWKFYIVVWNIAFKFDSFMTVCSCHVTYALESESTLYSCLNVKEHLAWSRHEVWRLGDCKWTWKQNHLVLKLTPTIWPNWPNDWPVFWVLVCTVHLTICSCHVTYALIVLCSLFNFSKNISSSGLVPVHNI